MGNKRIFFECTIPNCGKPNKAGGLCAAHYNRKRRNGDPLTVTRASNGSTELAIAEIVASKPRDECIIWPHGKNMHGYGVAAIKGKKFLAHRYICIVVNGEPPSDRQQCAHSCGNGSSGCVNPLHLRWANAFENQADKLLHGTDNRGEKSPLAKINASAAEYIFKSQERVTDLAIRYGVSKSTICDIKVGRSWAWLNQAA